MEDLTHIRSRTTVSKGQRDKHSKWAFAECRDFITYKANREGVQLQLVNPRNTSRRCPECLYCNKLNRKTRSLFECLQYGYRDMADYVAAKNIAAKVWIYPKRKSKVEVAVNQPMVIPPFIGDTIGLGALTQGVTSPVALAQGR